VVLTASSSESYALLFKLLAIRADRAYAERAYPLFEYSRREPEPAAYRLRFDGLCTLIFHLISRMSPPSSWSAPTTPPVLLCLRGISIVWLAGGRARPALIVDEVSHFPLSAVCRGAHRCRGPGLARAGGSRWAGCPSRAACPTSSWAGSAATGPLALDPRCTWRA